MFGKNLALVLLFILSSNAFSMNHGLYYHKRSLLRQVELLKNTSKKSQDDLLRIFSQDGYFNQKLDHKNSKSIKFKQRYFIDSKYAKTSASPVFYIICGEWNCEGTTSYSYVVELAKKVGAHLVALEHRFYGESLPTRKLTSEALEHLNLEAAINDLAIFQKYLMKEKGFNGKWVAFGGSYAGTLAAFYREKHPELVVGALASSAPVVMKNEFKEYDAHITEVVNKTECGDKVREAVKLIEARLEDPKTAKDLKRLFKSEKLVNDRDFLYVVADMLAGAVQYGTDKQFCRTLLGSNDLVEGYAKGGLEALSSMGVTPFEISLAVAEKVEVTPDDNMRQWLWQSCSEFGWFQVANGTGKNSSRSSQIDLDYHDEMCKRLFNEPMVADGALNDFWYFPLLNPETSRIIFTNGSNDPWLTLSLTDRSLNTEFNIFMMEDASHCTDLKAFVKIASVITAQSSMNDIIAKWVE